MNEVVCQMSVLVPELGVILLTGKDEEAIRAYCAGKYPSAKLGVPRYVDKFV